MTKIEEYSGLVKLFIKKFKKFILTTSITYISFNVSTKLIFNFILRKYSNLSSTSPLFFFYKINISLFTKVISKSDNISIFS